MIALAVFVKTPEYSKVKTRLAKDLGPEKTLQFYNHCIQYLDSMLNECKSRIKNLNIYWAVAERDALNSQRWKNSNCIYQGQGSLGDRLYQVQEQLFEKHQQIIFIGMDCLEITPELIFEVIEKQKKYDFILGPTYDGGYYIYSSQKKLPKQLWKNTPYSSEQTLNIFEDKLKKSGSTHRLLSLPDIDTFDDYTKYYIKS